MHKKLQKHFLVSSIIASELIVLKLSLLRREQLSPAVSVLKNSPKIFHITQKSCFQLNCLHIDP